MNTLFHSLAKLRLIHALAATLVLVSLALMVGPYPMLAPLPALVVLAMLWFGRCSVRPLLFYGIVFLIPFGSFRALGGELQWLRLHWLLAAMLALLVLVGMLPRKSIPDRLRTDGYFWGLVLAFFLVNVFTALNSRFPDVSNRFVMLLAAGYLLVALGIIMIDGTGYRQTLPRVIVGSIIVSSILAVLGYTMNIPLFVSPVSGRAVGGAPDPNNMALMIIYSLPLAVFFFLTARRPWVRLALLAGIGVNLMTIMLSFSRGGAIVLGLSLVLILWEFRCLIAPRNLGLLLGVAGLVLSVLLVLAPEDYGDRLKSVRDRDDFAINRRASYLVVARDLFKERPLLGSGPDTYSSRYAETEIGRSFKRQSESGRRKAHNTYIEVLIGSGLLGFVFFVLLLGYALRSFNWAKARFMANQMPREAFLTSAYRTSFLTLLLYLVIYSEVHHKYLLLSLAVSQVALRLARQTDHKGSSDAAG